MWCGRGQPRGVCVRMLTLAASVLRASPGFGRAASRAMGDLAAGKKAAAVKAVNEWVKVGTRYCKPKKKC